MRIVLEGGSGVGKSTLAKALNAITGVPVYRPFRGKSEHIPAETVKDMQDLGLSVNGWEEDLYTADMLSVVNSDVILDRSLPSAMAFNSVSSCALDMRTRRAIIRLWAERIVAARAVLVLVTCDAQLRQSRSPDRGGDWEVDGIRKAVIEAHREAPLPGLDVWSVDTGRATAAALAQCVARRAIGGHESSFITTLAGHGARR